MCVCVCVCVWYVYIYIYIYIYIYLFIYLFIYLEVNNGKESHSEEKNRKTNGSKSTEFMAKDSRRYNVSFLINHHQDFKDGDIKCWMNKEGCFIKYKHKGGHYIYKERTYNCSIIKSTFIFQKYLVIVWGNDVKQMETSRDITD